MFFETGADVVLVIATFVLVFNWGTVKKAKNVAAVTSGVATKESFVKFFREHGVDTTRYEEMRAELMRRGVPMPPEFCANVEPAEVMGELAYMIESVPYVRTTMQDPQPDFTTYSSKMEMWPRATETDDC
jgi:hypothetical protein